MEVGHADGRVGAVDQLGHHRAHGGGQDHRHEAGDGVLHHHHLHGEDHPGDGRVEGGGDGRRGAAGDQHPQAVVGQAQALPQAAGGGRPEMDRRTLAAGGEATHHRDQAHHPLGEPVAQREASLVIGQAVDHVDHPDLAPGGGRRPHPQADQRHRRQRHQAAQRRRQGLERLGAAAGQQP